MKWGFIVRKQTSKKIKATIVCLMVAVMLSACSMSLSSIFSSAKEEMVTIPRSEYEELSKYAELLELEAIVDAYFYEEASEEKMVDGALSGLLFGLEEPYTFYYTPEDFAKMHEEDEGEYAGVGMQIMSSYQTGICTISRVFTDSPAMKAGVKRGDILIKVEELDVTFRTLNEAVDIMRGKVGESVHVELMRGDEIVEFEIVREIVHVNRVSSVMLEKDIGYVSLYEFSEDSGMEFTNQVDALMKKDPKALIIDLRDNPGGWVDAAVEVADCFLPKKNIAIARYRDNSVEEYATKSDECYDVPLIVLMNEFSASSSEIVAGALQDYGRATIVGTQSFGKGIVQAVVPVGERGAGMQLTIAQYVTPNGNEVHKIGITPDVIAEMPEGDTEMYKIGDLNDPQLKVAYEQALKLVAQ